MTKPNADLMTLIDSSDSKAKRTATIRPGRSRRRGADAALLWALDDPSLRGVAAAAISMRGGPVEALPKLAAMLRDADERARGCAISALGALRSRSALEPLVKALHGERSADLRERIWQALGEIGCADEVRRLSHLLHSPGWDVKPDDKRVLLEPSERPVRRLPAEQLERIRRDIEGLDSADEDAARHAVSRLGRRRGQVVEMLAEATASPNSVVRHRALHALEAVGDPRAYPVALAMRDDPVDDTRWCALRIAGVLGGERAVPVLVEVLRAQPGCHGVAGAMEGLEAIGAPAVPALIPLLDDEHADVRAGAAGALRGIGDESAVPHIARLLDHPDPQTRTAGIDELGMMAEERLDELGQHILGLIERMVNDPEEHVRENAEWWCGEISEALGANSRASARPTPSAASGVTDRR